MCSYSRIMMAPTLFPAWRKEVLENTHIFYYSLYTIKITIQNDLQIDCTTIFIQSYQHNNNII